MNRNLLITISKHLAVSTLLLAVMLLPARAVFAADVLDPACQINSSATLCKDKNTQTISNNSIYGPDGFITKAAKIVSIIVGAAGIIMVVIGGLKFITSSGDPSSINSARNTIIYALVGLVIAASAQAIIVLVLNKL